VSDILHRNNQVLKDKYCLEVGLMRRYLHPSDQFLLQRRLFAHHLDLLLVLAGERLSLQGQCLLLLRPVLESLKGLYIYKLVF